MIKYIGSKRALTKWIVQVVEVMNFNASIKTVVDLFCGSCRVAHGLKARNYSVIANDHNTYAYMLARALIQADQRDYPPEKLLPILSQLEQLPPKPGWFTETYCLKARYFHPDNGARIEAIREAIEEYTDPELKAILLTSLMLSADKVDSTTGVQMAFLKQWAPRALNPLQLHYPPLLSGRGSAHQHDALELAGQLTADLFYLDPPYNQHSYLANYHVWETLVLWDKPETYGVAQKRVDVQKRKSVFNSRSTAKQVMEYLIKHIQAPHLLVSFNDEGFLTKEEIEAMLKARGDFVLCLTRPYKRYVGALIGIYNPQGKKVGQVSHTRNHEYLFVCTCDKKVYEAVKQESLYL